MTRKEFESYLLHKVSSLSAVLYEIKSLSQVDIMLITNQLNSIVYKGSYNMTEDDLSSSEKIFQAYNNLDYLIKDVEKLAFSRKLNKNSLSNIIDLFCPRFPFC